MQQLLTACLALVAVGCGTTSPPTTTARVTTAPDGSTPVVTVAPTSAPFPIEPFAAISTRPVPEELADRLQAALATLDLTGGGGMSATVMTADGSWSGTTGNADDLRAVEVDDQFAVASITKPVIATQVLLMAEAGEISLDDPAADHLPPGITFDTNGATIRQLLSHRSGLPDYYDLTFDRVQSEVTRSWTPTEILALLPQERVPAGTTFAYAETNYVVLQLVIEHARERSLVEVLRDDGSLAGDGIARLVYQPEERPTGHVAMPWGRATSQFEAGDGYLPSLASATAYHASGAIASDSPSLAQWWQHLCSGQIVSQASLTQMSAFQPAVELGDGYGLGLFNPASGYARGFGHSGELPGYLSWAACLPEEGAVIVVLTNHHVEDGTWEYAHGLARPLLEALRGG